MFTCPVKVCVALISLVPSGLIEMFASTQVLVAGPLLPAEPLVVRLSGTPPTVTVVEAFTTVTPATAEVSVVVQEPVAKSVRQLADPSEPGPLKIEKVIVVPAGAFT